MICPWTTFILFFCFVACLIGTFDQNCDRYCQCQNGKCDHVTRNCTCNLGWTGATCNNFSKSEIKLTFAFLIYLCTSSSVINIENTVCGDHTNIYIYFKWLQCKYIFQDSKPELGATLVFICTRCCANIGIWRWPNVILLIGPT